MGKPKNLNKSEKNKKEIRKTKRNQKKYEKKVQTNQKMKKHQIKGKMQNDLFFLIVNYFFQKNKTKSGKNIKTKKNRKNTKKQNIRNI